MLHAQRAADRCFFIGLPGSAAASVVVDRVVAVVNGEIITMSDLQREEAVKKVEGNRTSGCCSRT